MDSVKNIVKGVIISIIFTLTFLFAFSIILTYTNISESFTTPVIIIITAISIFIGSSLGNLKIKKKWIVKWSTNRWNLFARYISFIRNN